MNHNSEVNELACDMAANLVRLCLIVDRFAPQHIIGCTLNGQRYILSVHKANQREVDHIKSLYEEQQDRSDPLS